MRVIVSPAQGKAKIYRRDGKVLMYIAKVTLKDRVVTITPRQHIPTEELEWLIRACSQGEADEPCEPEKWKHGPDGWVTHVSAALPYREARLPRCDVHRLQMRRLLCPVSHPRVLPDEHEPA